jgi:hypothetical protein
MLTNLDVTSPKHINSIDDRNWILSFQQLLFELGWLSEKPDGIIGIRTTTAWAKFKAAHYQSDPHIVGQGSIDLLIADFADFQGRSHPVPKEERSWEAAVGIVLPSGLKVGSETQIVKGIPLTWGEMTKDLKRKPVNKQIEGNIVETAIVFGQIRDKMGMPLSITSGYRPANINRAIGGVFNSQHVQGLAIDFTCNDLRKLLSVVRSVLKERGSGGIGLGMAKGFIHFDIGVNRRSIVEFSY